MVITKASGYYTLKLEVTQQSQSVANNTSTLKWVLTLLTGSTYFDSIRVGYTVTIAGTTCANVNYSSQTPKSMNRNDSWQIASGTTTVAHGSDGTKKISAGQITASLNTQTGNIVPNISMSNSEEMELTPIPRAATITTSFSSALMGETKTISITKQVASHYVMLTYKFGNATGNITPSRTQSTSISWQVPKSLAAQVAAGSIRASGTITCTTYASSSGGSALGTDTVSFIAQIPPTVPTTSASDNHMGKTRTISLTGRAASNLTHTIQYAFGSGAGVVATKTSSTSVSWTVPTSLAQYVATNNASGSGSLIVTTYNGDAEVGSKSVSFTAAIPASTMTVKTARMGISTPFEITRASSQLSHKITYTFSAASGYAAGSSSATVSNTSLTWTPPYSLANQLNITGGVKSGTITYYLTTYNGTAQCGSNTYTATLNAPTASLNVPSSFVMGTSSNIQTIDQDSNFAHTIIAQYSSTTETFATKTTATNVPANFTVATWAPLIPTAKTLTVTIKQTVYASSGSSTVVAYNEYTATVSVPTTAPTASISTAVVTSLTGSFASIYVQNNAQCQVTCTFSSSTGAYIRSATMKIDGVTKNYSITGDNTSVTKSITSNLLQNSGSRTITVTVTDSRGYTGTYQTSITVVAYKVPTIIAGTGESNIVVRRTKADGTVDPDDSLNTYLQIKLGRTISSVNSLNTGYIAYKIGTGTETTISTSQTETLRIDQKLNLNLSYQNAYTVYIRVWDSVGNETTRTVRIPADSVTLDLRNGGMGVGIGMYSQGASRLDVAFNSWFNAQLAADRFLSFYQATNGGYSIMRLVPRWNYTDILGGTSDPFPASNYIEAWIKKVVETYNTATNTTFVGNAYPSGQGMIACYIYSCASDIVGGLPESCAGIYIPYNESTSANRGAIVRFGTASNVFWYDVILPQVSKEITLSYSTNNIVTSANFSSGVKLYQSGKACALHIQFTPTSTSGGSSYVTIGTIPSGSRPQQQVDVATHLDSNTFRLIDLRVTTTGNIQVYKNNTYTQTLRGNLAWITA